MYPFQRPFITDFALAATSSASGGSASCPPAFERTTGDLNPDPAAGAYLCARTAAPGAGTVVSAATVTSGACPADLPTSVDLADAGGATRLCYRTDTPTSGAVAVDAVFAVAGEATACPEGFVRTGESIGSGGSEETPQYLCIHTSPMV